MPHSMSTFANHFKKENKLRQIVIEISEIRKDEIQSIKQNIGANSTILTWAEDEPYHVNKLLRELLAIENQMYDCEAEYITGLVQFKQSWKRILTEKVDLLAPQQQYHKSQKKLSQTEKKIAECKNANQLDHLKHRRAELMTEVADRRVQLERSSVLVQQQLEDQLRDSYYNLGIARMTHFQKAATLQEKWFAILNGFKQSGLQPNSFQEFAKPLPSVNTNWVHGDDYMNELTQLRQEVQQLRQEKEASAHLYSNNHYLNNNTMISGSETATKTDFDTASSEKPYRSGYSDFAGSKAGSVYAESSVGHNTNSVSHNTNTAVNYPTYPASNYSGSRPNSKASSKRNSLDFDSFPPPPPPPPFVTDADQSSGYSNHKQQAFIPLTTSYTSTRPTNNVYDHIYSNNLNSNYSTINNTTTKHSPLHNSSFAAAAPIAMVNE